MDIIESHRLGLIEQFQSEAVALAGGPRDAGQRALVCHHVADMLGLAHGYALSSAEASLAIDDAVARIEARARWMAWRLKRGERTALPSRIAAFDATLRALDAERCAGLLTAYRLVATPSLIVEAEARLEPDLFHALRVAQLRRGRSDAAVNRDLFHAHQRWAEGLIGSRLDAAVEALAWPFGARILKPAIRALRIPGRAPDRGAMARCARRLRRSPRLPEGFAANPAQAFFQLQRQIVERRRRAAEGADLSADDAVRLAA